MRFIHPQGVWIQERVIDSNLRLCRQRSAWGDWFSVLWRRPCRKICAPFYQRCTLRYCCASTFCWRWSIGVTISIWLPYLSIATLNCTSMSTKQPGGSSNDQLIRQRKTEGTPARFYPTSSGPSANQHLVYRPYAHTSRENRDASPRGKCNVSCGWSWGGRRALSALQRYACNDEGKAQE